MQEALLQFITSQWPSVAILAIGWYFMVKYFMAQIDKKDQQNQSNLDRYILLSEKMVSLTEKNIEWMHDFKGSLNMVHPKLDAIHDDIKKALVRNQN
jgi:hypothetical protein